jgi:cob(I)yrinic acid a,c-diamide adenosyltransferase (EC 2.5.1.17)
MSDNNEKEYGFSFIFTGDGKGKTTAALGLALRAMGHGKKIYMTQFMKGRVTGEGLAVDRYLPDITLHQCGSDRFINKDFTEPVDIELAYKGLEAAREAIFSGNYDMVILDEINVAVEYGLIPLDALLDIMKNKPFNLYLGLTGRYAKPEAIDLADLVTEMKEIKHPYRSGASAREGFEY